MNSHKYRHFSQLELSYSANCMGLALHRGFKSYWWFCSHAHSYSRDNTHNFFASQNTVVRKKKKMSKEVTNTTGIYKKKKKKEKQRQVFGGKTVGSPYNHRLPAGNLVFQHHLQIFVEGSQPPRSNRCLKIFHIFFTTACTAPSAQTLCLKDPSLCNHLPHYSSPSK